MKITLRGGLFDGAEIEIPGWPELVVMRDANNKIHRYVYTDAPMEADGFHGKFLDHESDRTRDRLTDLRDEGCEARSLDGSPIRPMVEVVDSNVRHTLRELFPGYQG